ncbi:MAG TPA: amidohydrolase family protein [Bryobacteraceae bacterium]|nr:amidohydrolase family protein [Bryobacteraceae bacterium]
MDRNLEQDLMLAGARVAISATDSVRADLAIRRGRVHFSAAKRHNPRTLDLRGFLILPGLINAHDHLEFNLFPRLGRRHYENATAWAEDIYCPEEAPIRQHLQVPKHLRLLWGGVKNLLSGVTSVSHHNPYDPAIFERQFPVRVIKRFGWAHSLRFCSDVQERFRQTPSNAPFIIHAGEGRDAQARREIYQLDESRVLCSSTVIVHGVALEREDFALMKNRGSSIVWCPSSNYFTLGRTLSHEVVETGIPVALGTDSALTADGDFLDELAVAHRHANPCRIYSMVTDCAARVLRLTSGEGHIRDGAVADLLVVSDSGQTPAEALLSIQPELVIQNGRIKLLSFKMADRLSLWGLKGFEPIAVEGRAWSFIECPVSAAAEQVMRHLGSGLRLAGKKVVVC